MPFRLRGRKEIDFTHKVENNIHFLYPFPVNFFRRMDYYSTTEKYIRSKTHSNAHQIIFAKESDQYKWLVLEQKIHCEVEVRQTDNYGTITARDNYELIGNLPKCVGVERLCEGVNFQIPFNADEINLIYQFGE